jgi:hypothetical protein
MDPWHDDDGDEEWPTLDHGPFPNPEGGHEPGLGMLHLPQDAPADDEEPEPGNAPEQMPPWNADEAAPLAPEIPPRGPPPAQLVSHACLLACTVPESLTVHAGLPDMPAAKPHGCSSHLLY